MQRTGSFGMGLALSRPSSRLGGTAGFGLRSVPDTADRFYLVTRGGGAVSAIRLQRNVGAAADSANVGVKWPEWRVTGLGRLAHFDDDPASPAVSFSDDTGAQDLVGANAATKFFGSYHGLGAGGGLNSETLKIDGVAFDPTADAIAGDSFELRNSTTATDGTTSLTRDLSTTINGNGGLHYAINAINATAVAFVYVGMASASGADYKEADIRCGAVFDAVALGTGECRALLPAVRAVRLRDIVSGRYLTIAGNLPDLAGYLRAEIARQPTIPRSKAYLGHFTDVAALAGASWDVDFGVGAAGAQFAAANMLANDAWTTGWTASVPAKTGVAAGVLTLTGTGTGSDPRVHRAIDGCVTGQRYLMSVDVGGAVLFSGSSYAAFRASSNTNGSIASPVSAFAQSVVVGRNIQLFIATQDAPNQRLLVLQTVAANAVATTFEKPAVYFMT